MKKLFFIFLSFYTQVVLAQNLVPNPSFEDTVICPDAGGQVTRAKYWHSLENTPDYFHECCVYPQLSVPANNFAFQYAASGDAYCGMWTYTTNNFYRESLGAFLTNPLMIGLKYFVTFKLNFAYSGASITNCASNKIGILFSTNDYLSSPPPHNNFAQVYTDSIVLDTLNWTIIRHSFIADSAYIFISISNFFDDAQTDTIHMQNSTGYVSYYFIDDICVSTDSLYSEVWSGLPINFLSNNIGVYPNPASNNITINNLPLNCSLIEIYDTENKLTQSVLTKHSSTVILDISSYRDGVYSIVVRSEKSLQTKQFIKLTN